MEGRGEAGGGGEGRRGVEGRLQMVVGKGGEGQVMVWKGGGKAGGGEEGRRGQVVVGRRGQVVVWKGGGGQMVV